MSQADFAHYMECSIRLAVDLVNTLSPTSGHEHLPDTGALRAFLSDHLFSDLPAPTQEDLERVKRLRARLRAAFDAPDAEAATAILNDVLAKSGARPFITNHDGAGPWHMHATPPGTPLAQRVGAEAAMALAVVIAQDGFDRLRVCDGEGCQEVFVDRSRNRARRFCSPAVCGNRANVAAYRSRLKAARGSG